MLCDCKVDYLVRARQLALTGHYPHLTDLHQVTCRLPRPSQPSLPLLDTRPSQFLCPYQAHCFALCQCCDFFACDCRMQCPEGCTCYHDSTWKNNVIDCSSRGHTALPPLIPMDATSLHLDGNNLGNVLLRQAFIGRKKVESLFLNSSLLSTLGPRTLAGLTELRLLHLEHNQLTELHGDSLSNLSKLVELHLHNNRLRAIDKDAFVNLTSLQVLLLHSNLLAVLPSLPPSLNMVSLANNTWGCQCSLLHELQQVSTQLVIRDGSRLTCVTDAGAVVSVRGTNKTCGDSLAVIGDSLAVIPKPSHQTSVILVTVSLFGGLLTIVVIATLLFLYRRPIKAWLHPSNPSPRHTSHGPTLYDAFVLYAPRDEAFLQQVLLPGLDARGGSYRLCLQHRDVQEWHSVKAVCGRLLLILSPALLAQDYWPRLKSQLQGGTSGEKKPILVVLEEIPASMLSQAPELQSLLSSCPVLQWDPQSTGFWEKLRFLLPTPCPSPPPSWQYDTTLAASTDTGSDSTRSTGTGPGYGGQESEALYQELEPHYQSLDQAQTLEVMLPNGKMVAATLVRQPKTGRIIPMVQPGMGSMQTGGTMMMQPPSPRNPDLLPSTLPYYSDSQVSFSPAEEIRGVRLPPQTLPYYSERNTLSPQVSSRPSPSPPGGRTSHISPRPRRL